MSLASHSLVGTIRVEPLSHLADPPSAGDDSTLGLLLESLAFQETLAGEPIHVLVSARVSRFHAVSDQPLAVRANLPQLELDLAHDYEQLGLMAARPA